jgi:hypothetical protein
MLSFRGRLNRGAGGGIKMKSSMVDGGVGLLVVAVVGAGCRCLSTLSALCHLPSLVRSLSREVRCPWILTRAEAGARRAKCLGLSGRKEPGCARYLR